MNSAEQTALAKHIGVLPKTVNEICRGKRGISAEMAMKLSKALGGSPLGVFVSWWLNYYKKILSVRSYEERSLFYRFKNYI